MWINIDDADKDKIVEALIAARMTTETVENAQQAIAASQQSPLAAIAAARKRYAEDSNNDIEVDDDARITFPTSRSDGVWVMMWGWVVKEGS